MRIMRLSPYGATVGVVLAFVVWLTRFGGLNLDEGVSGLLGSVGLLAVVLSFGYLIGYVLGSMVIIVDERRAAIVEMLGKFHSVQQAGISLIPFYPLGKLRNTLNLQILNLDADVDVKTIDNAFLRIPIRMQYQVLPGSEKEAQYKLDDPVEQMREFLRNSVLRAASGLSFEEIFQNKDQIKDKVEQQLYEDFTAFGYEIVKVLVNDPQPELNIIEAFNAVIAAEREKDAATAQGEAVYVRETKKAEAEAESLRLKAKGLKDARTTVADGNAVAVKTMIDDVPGLTGKHAMDFFDRMNGFDAIRDAASSPGTVIIVPGNSDTNGGPDYASVMAAVQAALTEREERPSVAPASAARATTQTGEVF